MNLAKTDHSENLEVLLERANVHFTSQDPFCRSFGSCCTGSGSDPHADLLDPQRGVRHVARTDAASGQKQTVDRLQSRQRYGISYGRSRSASP